MLKLVVIRFVDMVYVRVCVSGEVWVVMFGVVCSVIVCYMLLCMCCEW